MHICYGCNASKLGTAEALPIEAEYMQLGFFCGWDGAWGEGWSCWT